MAKISYSKISTFKSCPQKYYLTSKYQVEITASALPFGNAVEAGIDILLKGKTLEEAQAEFHTYWHTAPKDYFGPAKQLYDSPELFFYANDFDEDLLVNDLSIIEAWKKELLPETKEEWDALVGKFQGQVKNNAYTDPSERKFAHRVMWLCCKRRGEIMLKAFQEHLLPEVEKVIATQKWVSIKNAEGDTLNGKIDYILKLKGVDVPVLVDFKTAGKFYNDHDLKTSDQLSSYAAVEKLTKIAYWVVIKNIKHQRICNKCDHERENNRKKNCEKCPDGKYLKVRSYADTQYLIRDIRKGEGQETLEDFSDVLTAMKNEINWKNPSSCFDFGKKCEFYDYCWNGADLESLPGIKKKKS